MLPYWICKEIYLLKTAHPGLYGKDILLRGGAPGRVLFSQIDQSLSAPCVNSLLVPAHIHLYVDQTRVYYYSYAGLSGISAWIVVTCLLFFYHFEKIRCGDDLNGIDFFRFFQFAAGIFTHPGVIELAAYASGQLAAILFDHCFRLASL